MAGVWHRILRAVSRPNYADTQMIDSTIVRAHQQATFIRRGADE
jgi:hypothetical protein